MDATIFRQKLREHIDLEYERLREKMKEYATSSRWSLAPLSEEIAEDTKYIIEKDNGGYIDVELMKDMVVVKLFDGSFHPIKRSDLFKVVKA